MLIYTPGALKAVLGAFPGLVGAIMKRFYISDLEKDTIKMLRSFDTAYFEKFDSILVEKTAANNEIFSRAFDAVLSGNIKLFYTSHTLKNGNRTILAYHKSPRRAGCVQLSRYCYINGDFCALSDSQYTDAAAAIRDGITPGAYIVQK